MGDLDQPKRAEPYDPNEQDIHAGDWWYSVSYWAEHGMAGDGCEGCRHLKVPDQNDTCNRAYNNRPSLPCFSFEKELCDEQEPSGNYRSCYRRQEGGKEEVQINKVVFF